MNDSAQKIFQRFFHKTLIVLLSLLIGCLERVLVQVSEQLKTERSEQWLAVWKGQLTVKKIIGKLNKSFQPSTLLVNLLGSYVVPFHVSLMRVFIFGVENIFSRDGADAKYF